MKLIGLRQGPISGVGAKVSVQDGLLVGIGLRLIGGT